MADEMKKSEELITFVEDRPGQDMRYSLDSEFMNQEIGFKPKLNFEDALQSTINWYKSNEKWWKSLSLEEIKDPTPWLK